MDTDPLATVRNSPKDPLAWLNLAYSLVEAGDRVKAKECFVRAHELDPELREAALFADILEDTPATENLLKSIYQGKRGRYIVIDQRPLAFGRSSILWIAKDIENKRVCIKSFRQAEIPETDIDREEFLREIVARQNLQHPNILPLTDYGVGNQVIGPFIILPICEGGSLRDRFKGQDFMNFSAFLPILEQLALAIDYAHSHGIVHGDIKPENILFPKRDGSFVYLSDFGNAVFFPIRADITTKGPIGTTNYISPEQIADNRQTPLSDIYSLATVVYEALTGDLPIDRKLSPFQQMSDKVAGRIVDPWQRTRKLDQAVREGLIAGLSADPKSRPKSAGEFVRLLKGEATVSTKVLKDLERAQRHSGLPNPHNALLFHGESSRLERVILLYRTALAVLIALVGITIVSFFPAWPWLAAHPGQLRLRASAALIIVGIAWAIADPKRREWAIAILVLGVTVGVVTQVL